MEVSGKTSRFRGLFSCFYPGCLRWTGPGGDLILAPIACMVRKYYNEYLRRDNPGRHFIGRQRKKDMRGGPGKGNAMGEQL